jgi:hypothetical protein
VVEQPDVESLELELVVAQWLEQPVETLKLVLA